MRIAISTDGGFVSPHFGRCPSFTIVDVEDGKLTGKEVIENPGHQPGLIPQFLHEKGVECMVAGGMGMRAAGFFEQMGIKAILGVSGEIEDVIGHLLDGTLKGGESLCMPGLGRGYGLEKEECENVENECEHEEKKGK